MGIENDLSSPDFPLDETGAFLGTRIRELRAGRRVSQAALADEMTRRGFRWYHTTVYRIESGSQVATFNEAVALAEFFDVPLDTFRPAEDVTS